MSKITGFTQYLKHFELSFLFLGSLTEFWTFQYVVENCIRSWSSSSFSEELAKNRTLLCWEMRKHIRQFFPQRACRLVPSRVVSLMWKLECRCMKLKQAMKYPLVGNNFQAVLSWGGSNLQFKQKIMILSGTSYPYFVSSRVAPSRIRLVVFEYGH